MPEALERASSGVDPERHHICRSAALVVSRGVPLSAALRPYAHRLPELVLPVLEVGELSGTLDAAARRLSDAFGRRAAAERRFRYAVFDPWLVILALTLIKATRLVGDGPLGIIQGMLTTLLTLAAYYLGGRLLVRALLCWPWLRLQVDTIKVTLPHRGAVVRNLAAARWARSTPTTNKPCCGHQGRRAWGSRCTRIWARRGSCPRTSSASSPKAGLGDGKGSACAGDSRDDGDCDRRRGRARPSRRRRRALMTGSQ